MTSALTPELAVDYLRELSADIRATAVLTAAGEALAGPEELAAPARELLDAAPGAAELQVITGDGTVYASRDEHHAIVAVCGRFALPALIRFDLKVVLAELAPGGGGASSPGGGGASSPSGGASSPGGGDERKAA
jgi:uncharacterized membrane protein YgcG